MNFQQHNEIRDMLNNSAIEARLITYQNQTENEENRQISLELSYNILIEVPIILKKIRNLTKLNMNDNKIREFPPILKGEFRELSVLNLPFNELMTLPESFGNLTTLRTLNIYNNKLISLPDSFGNLSSLVALYLSYNKLTALPNNFGNLTLLQTLDLSNNKLTNLPDSFTNLVSLRSLDLGGNTSLARLPENIGNLRNLTSLNLIHCSNITQIPDSAYQLTNLINMEVMGMRNTPSIINFVNYAEQLINANMEAQQRQYNYQPGVRNHGIDAMQIHTEYKKFNKSVLDMIIKPIVNRDDSFYRNMTSQEFIRYINDKFVSYINTNNFDKPAEEKQQYTKIINELIWHRLKDTSFFNSNALRIQVGNIVDFIFLQPKEVINLYIELYVEECGNAHANDKKTLSVFEIKTGESNAYSCPAGTYERLMTIMEPTFSVICTSYETLCKPVYKEILKKVFKVYQEEFVVNNVLQKWDTEHLNNEEYKNRYKFDKMNVDVRKKFLQNDLREFMRQEFIRLNLSVDEKVINDTLKMVEELEVFENMMFGGGKRVKKRKTIKLNKKKKHNITRKRTIV